MKKVKVLSVVLFALFLVFILGGCEAVELGENEVKAKVSASSLVDTHYEEVVEKLKQWGFKNIKTEPVYDIIWGFTKEGTTKSVTIDGTSDFKYGDIFDKNVEIIIIYSMKESNDPAKKTYDIVWKNHDGTTLKTDKFKLGATPNYTGIEPARASEGSVKYFFDGWSPVIETVTESKTYTATYIEVENILTATFDLDGGHWELQNSQSVNYNSLITQVIPTKSGFDFGGWVEKGFWSDTKFNSTTNVTKDYNLTATWTTIKYTVIYDLDGGTWSRSNEQFLNFSEKITTTNPTKEGHSFMGWFVDDVKFDVNTPIINGINLKAHWYFINYEEILSGRWEGWNSAAKAHGFEFIEFDGNYSDVDGKRTSILRDFDYKWATFTLNGNVMVINFGNGPIVFTVSYNANSENITLNGAGYPNMLLIKTEDEPNSIAWKWQHLYEFAKTQSKLKTDTLGNYYEITLNLNLRNISPNSKLVESNNQTIKVYTHKVINITLTYVGVNEPEVEMVVNLVFKHDEIEKNRILDPFIHIESENYVMFAKEGTTNIQFDEGVNQFFFITQEVKNYGTQFPGSGSTFIYDLMYFTETTLYEMAYYLLVEHDIYMFTK